MLKKHKSTTQDYPKQLINRFVKLLKKIKMQHSSTMCLHSQQKIVLSGGLQKFKRLITQIPPLRRPNGTWAR